MFLVLQSLGGPQGPQDIWIDLRLCLLRVNDYSRQ